MFAPACTGMDVDPRYKAVCFDMDGTLLDTKVDYEKMSNIIFDEMVKVGVPEEVIDRSEGYKFNLDSGVNYLFSNGRAEDVYAIGLKVAKIARDIEMEKVDEAKPFPKAKELLEWIHSKGMKTGLLTRGCREYAIEALKVCGVSYLLDAVVARDDYPEKEAKPSPKAMEHIADMLSVRTDEILFFGDHMFDYQCAKDAGSGFVGVLTGTYTREDWLEIADMDVYESIGDFYDHLD